MAVVEQVEVATSHGRRLSLSSPATGASLGELDLHALGDLRAVVERARKASMSWAELPVRERSLYLERVLRGLVHRQDEVADAIVAETGKPRSEALSLEVLPACDALQFYARRARRILADRTPPLHLVKTKKLRIVHRPLGVVGVITSWQLPFFHALNPTIQALVAGNAVVQKPSLRTPLAAGLLRELFEAAGLPENLVNVVHGDERTGAALVDAGIDKIHWSGSAPRGRQVALACARRLVPCTLTLDGKDAMIVCEDADLDRAARGAVYGAFANAGQLASSTERVFVVESIADAFTERVLAHTAALRQGARGEFDVGALAGREQLAHVEAQVDDARARGARVRSGGRRNPHWRPGWFYEPTVLVDVTPDMQVMREPTVGPVLPIMRVQDASHAIGLANASDYGMGASVWTRNRQRGVELARALESGSVVVNDCSITHGVTESPMGGIKQSGLGRSNGEIGLKSYCSVQSILVDRLGGRRVLAGFPYGIRRTRLLRRVIDAVWGGSLGRWIS